MESVLGPMFVLPPPGFMVYSAARPKTGTFTSQCLLANWSAFTQGTKDRYPVLI
jgi:hypothetical protein